MNKEEDFVYFMTEVEVLSPLCLVGCTSMKDLKHRSPPISHPCRYHYKLFSLVLSDFVQLTLSLIAGGFM